MEKRPAVCASVKVEVRKMKWIFGGFIFVVLFSSIMYVQLTIEEEDQKEVNSFVNSHGKTKVPSTWRGLIGKGI